MSTSHRWVLKIQKRIVDGGDRLRRRTLVFGSLLRVGIASGSSSTRCHNGPSNSRKTGNTKGRRASCINKTKDTHSSCLVSPHYLTRACASTSLDRSGPAHRRTSFPFTCARLLVARAARAQGPAALIRKRKKILPTSREGSRASELLEKSRQSVQPVLVAPHARVVAISSFFFLLRVRRNR